MPQLILNGVPLVAKPPTEKPKPPIEPDAMIEQWVETAWVLAQLDAWDAQEHARQVLEFEGRLQRGRTWLQSHESTHPRYREAQSRVLHIEYQIDNEMLAVRCYERACWMRCVETHGFCVNGGIPTKTPQALWESLMGLRPMPELSYVNGCLIVPPRTGAAPWELDSLRKSLAKRPARSLLTRWPEEAE